MPHSITFGIFTTSKDSVTVVPESASTKDSSHWTESG